MTSGSHESSTLESPARGATRFDRRDALAVVVLLVVCLAALFFRLGAMGLWDRDEGMHAATSRDMVKSGDWVTPRFNGEKFYDKPAFFNWFVAASFVVFDYTEFAARLPAALFGLGTVLVTFWLGRAMFGRGVGLLAGAVLCTSILFLVLSRIVVHDIALTFAQTLALAALFRAAEAESRGSRWWLLFYAAAALAVLAKGPVGLLLPGLVAGLYALATRRPRLILDMLSRPLGLLLFVAIAAPWYVAMSVKHDDYVRSFLLEKNFGSFLGIGEPNHPRPFYYYVPVLFSGFFPWSCFLPMAVLHAAVPADRPDRRPLVFLLIWITIVFVFFSVATSKLSTYILPLFPAAALLVAYVWHDLLTKPYPKLRRGFLISWLPMVGVALAFVAALPLLELPERLEGFGITAGSLAWVAAPAAAGVCLGFVLFLTRRSAASFWSIVVTTTAVMAYLFGVVGPPLDGMNSTKQLAGVIDELLPEGAPIPMFAEVIGTGDSALFYTDRKAFALPLPDQLDRHLASDEPVYCLVASRHLDLLETVQTPAYVVADSGGRLIISNRPATAEPGAAPPSEREPPWP